MPYTVWRPPRRGRRSLPAPPSFSIGSSKFYQALQQCAEPVHQPFGGLGKAPVVNARWKSSLPDCPLSGWHHACDIRTTRLYRPGFEIGSESHAFPRCVCAQAGRTPRGHDQEALLPVPSSRRGTLQDCCRVRASNRTDRPVMRLPKTRVMV